MLWTNKTPVYLYGAAGFGTLVYRNLNEHCNISAFIDKRFDEIKTYLDLPVLDVNSLKLNGKEAVVIVCIKNIFEHEPITLMLLEKGFKYVVYHPVDESMYTYRDNVQRQKLIDIYSSITDGTFSLPYDVPSSDNLFRRQFSDSAIIKSDDKNITALIPAIFVYSRPKSESYLADVPALALFSHLELFDYLSGSVECDYKCYMDILIKVANEAGTFEKTPRWQEDILKSRKMVFERMHMASETSPLFFVEHAVEAIWDNSGKHFNMLSGKHRAAYIIHKYHLFIPLVISHEDYKQFLNIDAANALDEFMTQSGFSELPFPVLHPYFIKTVYALGSNFYNLLYNFVRWLSKELYLESEKIGTNGIGVFDATGLMFPFLQCLNVLGYSVDSTKRVTEFEALVERLYHISASANVAVEKSDYDVTIIKYGQEKQHSFISRARYCAILTDDTETVEEAGKYLGIKLKPLGTYSAEGHRYVFSVGICGIQ